MIKGMCKASKHLEEIDNVIKSIKYDHKLLSEKVSKYDIAISDHYHKIETVNFNACEGYYLTKQLQELLRKRRIIKDEFSRLNALMQTLEVARMHNSINKSKQSITEAKKKSAEWQRDWKYTYSLEEVLH
jgi:hypothetical protein